MENLTPEEVIFMKLIDHYSTPDVEQNLSNTSHLQDDLGLSSLDIVYLGMYIEDHYQRESKRAFRIPDEYLRKWRTIPDIIESLNELLEQS